VFQPLFMLARPLGLEPRTLCLEGTVKRYFPYVLRGFSRKVNRCGFVHGQCGGEALDYFWTTLLSPFLLLVFRRDGHG